MSKNEKAPQAELKENFSLALTRVENEYSDVLEVLTKLVAQSSEVTSIVYQVEYRVATNYKARTRNLLEVAEYFTHRNAPERDCTYWPHLEVEQRSYQAFANACEVTLALLDDVALHSGNERTADFTHALGKAVAYSFNSGLQPKKLISTIESRPAFIPFIGQKRPGY